MNMAENSNTLLPEGRRTSPVILILKGEDKPIPLTEGKHTIGCGDVDIVIGENDKFVSDHQSTLTVEKDLLGEWALYLQDTPNTVNLTRINGEACKDEFNYRLYEGDIIRMGMTYLSVHFDV